MDKALMDNLQLIQKTIYGFVTITYIYICTKETIIHGDFGDFW